MILSIVIINYNSRSVLLDCLNSIERNVSNLDFEVLVIDNNSYEPIIDLEALFPWVTFVYNKKNLGFAVANNIGIQRSSGRFVLLLNPDTVVNQNTFNPMISYLDEHKEVGIVGCKIYNQEGKIERSTHSFPSLAKEFVHANEFIKMFLSYDSFSGRMLKRILKIKSFESYWDHDSIKEVDHITGACMMIKREVINKVGLLDEAFFLYNEEVEWSYRIRKAGYKTIFLPDSNIIHLFGFSTKQRVQKQTINKLLVERYRGMFYYFQKHYGFTKLLLLKIIVLQGFGLRWLFTYIKFLKSSVDQKEKLKLEMKYIKDIILLIGANNFDWRKNS
ncbi:MAG: glycosyltransferase family 2 protein [Ignavibacteriaceae bacterium]|nr:glycosyltransferase family 2 protein [Ignavibacteriaceae bacterium]